MTGVTPSIHPLPTITGTDNGAQIAAVSITKNYTGVIGQGVDRPIDTITSVDHNSLLAVHLTQYHNEPAVSSCVRGQAVDEPIKALDTQNRFGAVAAHLVKFRGDSVGTPMSDPVPTVTSGAGAARDAGAAHAMGVAAAYLSHAYTSNTCGGQGDPRKPHKTITGGGHHSSVCVVYLTPYYGSDKEGAGIDRPMPTVVSHDRFGLAAVETNRHFILTPAGLARAQRVARWARKMLGKKVERFLLPVKDEAGKLFHLLTVTVKGAIHLVTDILMRMLKPRELARAQGFDDSYVIDRMVDPETGKLVRLGKADQVKLIGNSVCPAVARAIVTSNIVKQGLLGPIPKARIRRSRQPAEVAA